MHFVPTPCIAFAFARFVSHHMKIISDVTKRRKIGIRAFAECELHKTNLLECEFGCELNRTLTHAALFVTKMKKSNTEEVRK